MEAVVVVAIDRLPNEEVDVAEDKVTEPVKVLVVSDEELVLVPPAVPPFRLSIETEHLRTSRTACFPSLSVTGVSVISHVSVNGPAFV